MQPATLVPRDKFDTAAVDRLREADYASVEPILSELLDWTADRNWPVAAPLADFLITVGAPLVGPITHVLQGDDSTQKEHCLRLVVSRLPLAVLAELEGELRRLAERPTESDRREEADLAAHDALVLLANRDG